tara:strand:+ start:617 stop:910 length:294 start_codon:yes stop_codon:yes gene_type:complete
MTLGEHFFYAPLCKYKLSYCMGWFFIIIGYTFVISIILANPLKLHYGASESLVKCIFISAGLFLVTIFSRCICYKKQNYEDDLFRNSNILYYTEQRV